MRYGLELADDRRQCTGQSGHNEPTHDDGVMGSNGLLDRMQTAVPSYSQKHWQTPVTIRESWRGFPYGFRTEIGYRA